MNHISKKWGKILLSCLVALLFFFSCGNKNVSTALLDKAYNLIEIDPHGALILLDSVKNPMGMDQKDYMSFVAASVYARLKSNQNTQTDTLVYVAQNYFNERNLIREASIANFASGYVHFQNHDIQEAMESFLQAYSFAMQNSDTSLAGKSLNNIGYIFSDQDMMDSAIVYLNKALLLYNTLDNVDILKLKTYSTLGEAYDVTKQNKRAQQSFFDGLKIAEKNSNSEFRAIFKQNLGVTYLSDQDYKKTITYCLDALQETHLTSDSLKYTICYRGLYIGANNKDSASFYRNLLQRRLQEIQDPYTLKIIYKTMADFAHKEGNLEQALYYKNLREKVDIEINAKTIKMQ